jgi:hypothetical protein
MAHAIMLAPVLRQLEQGNCTLEQLWLDNSDLWQQLGWGQAQVRLWLRCLPGIFFDEGDPVNPSYRLGTGSGQKEPSLADQLVGLLESAGRPMPLPLLMNKLPYGVVVTEPMLRAVINADPRLQMTGPLVKLV